MKVHALGHAAIKVRDVERAERFHNGLLGIPVAARDPVGHEYSIVPQAAGVFQYLI